MRNINWIKLLLLFVLAISLSDCKKRKFIPEEFESLSSRYGELKMFDVLQEDKLFRKIVFGDDEIYESENLQLVQLNQIIQLNNTDMFLFTVESLEDNSDCPAKFLVITLNSEKKFKTFPEVGNCNDTPEIVDNGEKVTFSFEKILSYPAISYKYENDELEVIEGSKKTAGK